MNRTTHGIGIAVLLGSALGSACTLNGKIQIACNVDADCDDGRSCIAQVCGGEKAPTGNPTGNPGPTGSGATAGSGAGSGSGSGSGNPSPGSGSDPSGGSPEAPCSGASPFEKAIATASAMKEELHGTWRSCGGGVVSATERGIELDALNGTWFGLKKNTAGRTVRDLTPGASGTFAVTGPAALPNHWGLELRTANGTRFTGAAWRSEHGHLLLAFQDGATPSFSYETMSSGAPARCAEAAGAADPIASQPELQAKISGPWLYCTGDQLAANLGALGENVIGIEFAGGGQYHLLEADGVGRKRMAAAEGHGTYYASSDFALTLTPAGGAEGYSLSVTLAKDPTGGVKRRRMIVTRGAARSVYVFDGT